jgi:hypothetical protein
MRGVHIELEPVDLGLQFRGPAERGLGFGSPFAEHAIHLPLSRGGLLAVPVVVAVADSFARGLLERGGKRVKGVLWFDLTFDVAFVAGHVASLSVADHPSPKTRPPRGAVSLALLAFERHGMQGPYRRIGPTAATLAAVALPTTQPK